MALTIQLEDEEGNVIESIFDVGDLQRALPESNDSSFSCLRFVDDYGDTVFNRLQAPVVLQELSRVRPAIDTIPEGDFFAELLRLVNRCRVEPHVYLRFVGD
jgi:hypothetical protein